ncbi:hypothetical protein L873DRAFT_1800317 [Choiromyces venosus 120613-1]|uniref:Cell wall protein n=1 Tax=Choiromyces venosus 120613-1 TaxID=1336337 RepID=A0A3N4JZM6_9PEZI|nr:hypothetical protein L873DRAFT_1800317 [Choiromyces venosus 120613-1]
MLAHQKIAALLLAFMATSAIAAPTMRIPADELVKRGEELKGGEFGDEPYVRVDSTPVSKPLVKRGCSPGPKSKAKTVTPGGGTPGGGTPGGAGGRKNSVSGNGAGGNTGPK